MGRFSRFALILMSLSVATSWAAPLQPWTTTERTSFERALIRMSTAGVTDDEFATLSVEYEQLLRKAYVAIENSITDDSQRKKPFLYLQDLQQLFQIYNTQLARHGISGASRAIDLIHYFARVVLREGHFTQDGQYYFTLENRLEFAAYLMDWVDVTLADINESGIGNTEYQDTHHNNPSMITLKSQLESYVTRGVSGII